MQALPPSPSSTYEPYLKKIRHFKFVQNIITILVEKNMGKFVHSFECLVFCVSRKKKSFKVLLEGCKTSHMFGDNKSELALKKVVYYSCLLQIKRD